MASSSTTPVPMGHTVQFDGVDEHERDRGGAPRRGGVGPKDPSAHSLISAPPAPPHEHRRTSLLGAPMGSSSSARLLSADDVHYDDWAVVNRDGGNLHRFTYTFGGLSKRTALREIRQARKKTIIGNLYDIHMSEITVDEDGLEDGGIALSPSGEDGAGEDTPLMKRQDTPLMKRPLILEKRKTTTGSVMVIPESEDKPMEALKEMFLENKINLLLVFLPFAYWSQAAGWSGGSVFVICFIAMVPLASMLGVFTEELATHTNDVTGGLINATFGNAVEMVVAIQALLANDYRVVQASLIGSIFSNLLLVLGMCFLCGGIHHSEQEFIAQGAVASIALLGFFGLMLLLPEFFGDGSEEGGGEPGEDIELRISRVGALFLVLMYAQLLFFQLKTHVHLFQGEDDVVALIPFSWSLIGLVVITGMVTVLSEWLVGSIDGFCEQFNMSRSFVGVILLPVVGNAVEHISAITVAMKNKMDLALGIALGSSVQIGLFVMPLVVLIGAFTDRAMTMKFPSFEVYLYLLSVIIVSLCLTNSRSNWLEGSLLVFTYGIVAVGIYFEEKDIENS